MASCPKCGKGKIKKRDGVKKCNHCGVFGENTTNPATDDGVVAERNTHN